MTKKLLLTFVLFQNVYVSCSNTLVKIVDAPYEGANNHLAVLKAEYKHPLNPGIDLNAYNLYNLHRHNYGKVYYCFFYYSCNDGWIHGFFDPEWIEVCNESDFSDSSDEDF